MSEFLIEALRSGEAIIVATDTVHGLAAMPGSKGFDRIFELKQRPRQQALPWLIASADELDRLGREVPAYARRLAAMFWPGALTLVVRASEEAAAHGQTGPDGTIALRCPDDEALLSMLEELGGPLACTSANVHGDAPATRRAEVPASMQELPGFDALVDIPCASQASTIVDCMGPYPKILRDGPIPEQVVLDVAAFGATLDV